MSRPTPPQMSHAQLSQELVLYPHFADLDSQADKGASLGRGGSATSVPVVRRGRHHEVGATKNNNNKQKKPSLQPFSAAKTFTVSIAQML